MAELLEFAAGAEASEGVFEGLPCMAMVVREGVVVARNALMRRMTGFGEVEALRVEQVLVGAYDFGGSERRLRFECLAVRRHGPPVRVSAAVQGWVWGGEVCRLVLLMERMEGFAGAVELEGSFLEEVLDATPEATVIAHEGRVLHVNREFSRLFGYSAAECMGAELDDLVMPDGRMHENELIWHTLARHGRAEMETVRRTRTGEAVDVAVLVSRVRLGGEAFGLFVTYRDIRRQKQEEARLQHTALHDGLTGLANRALFLDRAGGTLARLKRRPDRNFAVLFVDLDGFKQVNDTLGHAAGDELLLEVAERLVRCLRPQDTVARFGGDEFALLLDEIGSADDMQRVIMRVQDEVRRPMVLKSGKQARISGSMGVALGTTEYAAAEELLRDADQAMYEAKKQGKARCVVFGSAAA